MTDIGQTMMDIVPHPGDDDRCLTCGFYLKITGAWVGECHYDDFAIVECKNPKCKTNRKEPTKESAIK